MSVKADITKNPHGIVIECCSVNHKTAKMKKLLLFVMLFTGMSYVASAQGDTKKAKVKKTSTVPQKIHNTVSKHKKYSGVKAKSKVDKAQG